MTPKKEEKKLVRVIYCPRCLTRLTTLEDATTGQTGLWCSTCKMTSNGKVLGQ